MGGSHHSLCTPETARALYERLYLIRRCEEKIVEIYFDDEMKTPMHMSMGQEAVSVGVCEALRGNCDVTSSYRSHAAFLAQTGDVERFFGELHGRVNGTADGKSGSMHLADPGAGMLSASGIVAAGIPVAIGAAFANKVQNPGRVSVAFFGDGAVDEAGFWESLNASCALGLPVLFVCEDNDLAVHTRADIRRGYETLAGLLNGFNCSFYEDDSNDVERIFRLVEEAATKALSESGPAFLQIKTYRYLEHCGTASDPDAPYRRAEEHAHWTEIDCVPMQRNRLLGHGLTEDSVSALEQTIDARIEDAVKAAKAAAHPTEADLLKGVFHA